MRNRNTDSAQNHVDRVRVPDPNCQFGGPGRGSGWRHRSLSNIDLTSQSKHSFTKQTKGYTSSLYDLYSRLEARKDKNELENLYGNTNGHSGKYESKCDIYASGWAFSLFFHNSIQCSTTISEIVRKLIHWSIHFRMK